MAMDGSIIAEGQSIAAGIVLGQRARYERLWGALTKRQHALAEAAIAGIEAELMAARRGSWSAAMAAATLVQLAEATRGLTSSQMALLTRTLPAIAAVARMDTSAYLRELDKHYLGVARPLRWDSLEWLEGYRRPLLRSRLRIYERSFARYGAEAVAGIEDAVAKAALLGKPWTDARESVMSIVREQVGGRQWMVDRIVRTETATVYSSTSMAALLEEDEPDDPMLKKLVAVFDKVTGLDSKILHGQTRRVQELFTDVVNGRQFDAPPNRPNDREIVVGWRSSYGDSRAFDTETRTGDAIEDLGEADALDLDREIEREAEAQATAMKPRRDRRAELAKVEAELAAKKAQYLAGDGSFDEQWGLERKRDRLRFAIKEQEEYEARQAILDAQDAEAGGRGLPMQTNTAAIRALEARGVEIVRERPSWAKPGWDFSQGLSEEDDWVRVLEAELRSLERLRAAPRVTKLSLLPEEDTAAARAGIDKGDLHLFVSPSAMRKAGEYYERHEAARKRGRVPWTAVYGDKEAQRIADRFRGLDRSQAVGIVQIIRHEFGHGIEHYLQIHETKSDEYRDLISTWALARNKVTAESRRVGYSWVYSETYKDAWSRISEYAKTDEHEMIAEAMSLALAGEYDSLPEALREPIRQIIEYELD